MSSWPSAWVVRACFCTAACRSCGFSATPESRAAAAAAGAGAGCWPRARPAAAAGPQGCLWMAAGMPALAACCCVPVPVSRWEPEMGCIHEGPSSSDTTPSSPPSSCSPPSLSSQLACLWSLAVACWAAARLPLPAATGAGACERSIKQWKSATQRGADATVTFHAPQPLTHHSTITALVKDQLLHSPPQLTSHSFSSASSSMSAWSSLLAATVFGSACINQHHSTIHQR